MRKRTLRNGMRLVLGALAIILVVSFFHAHVAELFALSIEAEMRLYRLGIFWAAAIGGYGVVLSAFGLVLPGNHQDNGIRVRPLLFMIVAAVSLFFYLLAASFDAPDDTPRQRLRPGETITI
jgi:hypothetical protein